MILWSAIVLGLLGSTHCVAMCGPIVLGLPLNAREKREVLLQSFLYHIGRVVTYGILGFFFGLLGWGIALAGYQKTLSIVLGLILIWSAGLSILHRHKAFSVSWFQRLGNWVSAKLKLLFSKTGRWSVFAIGLLNGILPCGLVYIALVGAVATGNHMLGALYMMAFGLGTMPLMLGLMVFGKYSKAFFYRLRGAIPFGLLLFGVFMVYRGMNLEIPAALSFWESTNFQIMCH